MKTIEINMDAVYPSVGNTRMDYNGQDMAELIKSIESVGLLNPIIVRMIDEKGGHEIIAGHRRFHALKKLGRETVSARVVEATADGAMQIRIIENLHRKNLNSIEEAEAFKMLMMVGRMSLGEVADRSDKTVNYVTRALALLTLPRVAVDAIRSGDLPASHGHQIARAGIDKQEALSKFATHRLSYENRLPTFDELKRQIEKTIEKDLSAAVFPKEIPYAEVIACTSCPYNSGNQDALFDGAEKGLCTSPSCFNKKTNAFYKSMGEEGSRKFPGLKFLGATSSDWGDKQFRSFPVVDHKAKKETIEKNPDHFAIGVLKPSQHGSVKKPRLVVVRIKGKPEKSEQPRAEEKDWDKERFVNDSVQAAMVNHVYAKVKGLTSKHLYQIAEIHGGENVMVSLGISDKGKAGLRDFQKLDANDQLKIVWLSSISGWQFFERLGDVGIDIADAKKKAKEEAVKLYEESKVKKEKKK